jgi:hypothetical protein
VTANLDTIVGRAYIVDCRSEERTVTCLTNVRNSDGDGVVIVYVVRKVDFSGEEVCDEQLLQ